MENCKKITQEYKDSSLGIIPLEWEVKRLGEIASKIGDGIHGTPKYVANSNYYFINGNNLIGGNIIINSDTKCVSEDEYKFHKKELDTNTILMSINGTIGNLAIFRNEKVMLGKSAAYMRFGDNLSYFYQILQSPIVQNYFISELSGSTIKNLSLKSIREAPIPFPPLEEQRRISEVLGCWDEAIERQSQMVDLLITRKRALMQRLLTPQSHWQKTKLGNIAERITRKNAENNTNVMTISAQRGFVSQTDFFNKSIASEITDNYFLVHKDEFCYNKSYCNGYPMGAIKRLKNADKAVVTTLYICFRIKCNKCSIKFLEHFFEAGLLNRHLMKIANEGGRAHGLLNVTPSDFFAIQFLIPSLGEQKDIAEQLSTADAEIDLVRHHLDLLRTQKRALMQQLLTGKKRVKS